jgi:hypothetical protein
MNIQNNLGLIITLVVIASIIITLILSYIYMRIIYKPIFDWWYANGGEKYKNQFSISTLVSANYSSFLYAISKLFSGPLNQLNVDAIRFIIGKLFPYMTYVQNGKQFGILTPKMMCETIKLGPGDNDQLFDNWFSSYTRGGLPLKEGAPLKYTKSQEQKNSNVPGGKYYYYAFEKQGNYSGIYPQENKGGPDWAGLILEWLNGTSNPSSNPTWVLYKDADGNEQTFLLNSNDPDPYKHWTSRPDNFLGRMGIYPDSPLVVYFINNKYSANGFTVDAQAFQNLLAPAGSVAGGWVGYLNGASGSNYDDYANILYTTVQVPLPPPPPQCKKPDVARGIFAGLGTALGILGAALMVPVTGGASLAIAGTIGVAGVASGVYNGIQAGKGTCS